MIQLPKLLLEVNRNPLIIFNDIGLTEAKLKTKLMRIVLLLLLIIPFISKGQWLGTGDIYYTSGNVGIGTTSPTFPLTVQGNIQGRGWAAFTQTSPVNSLVIDASSSTFHKIYNNVSNVDLSIGTNSSITQLYLKSNGNIGIGTTNPLKSLDINTSINADGLKIGAGVTSTESSANVYLYPSSNYSSSRNWLISTYYNNIGDFVIRSGNAHGSDPYSAGTTHFSINSNGNIGIGTTNPLGKLDVHTPGSSSYSYFKGDVSAANLIWSAYNDNVSGEPRICLGYRNNAGAPRRSWYIGSNSSENLFIGSRSNAWGAPGDNDFFTISNTGNVGIGTTNSQGYKLAVNGDAIFTKVKVKTYGSWPDYVFHQSFKLRPLKDLEAYIKANNHLPEVPSAKEVNKEGLNLGENQAVLLKKIEELTLYIIEQNKQLQSQDKRIKDLEKGLRGGSKR